MLNQNKDIAIAIFSFNRGDFLVNCIKSIDVNINNMDVYVFDDNSDCKDTVKILNDLHKDQRCTIIFAKKGKLDAITGGLHNNMNQAFSYLEARKYKYVLVLQDDMQVLRNIDSQEFIVLKNQLEQKQKMQIVCNFLKPERKKNKNYIVHYSENKFFFQIKSNDESAATNYSDTGFFSIEKKRKYFGDFEIGERANMIKAKRKNIILLYYSLPFYMWLPLPECYRNKKKSIRTKLYEKLSKVGFFPYENMSESSVKRLYDKVGIVHPYADLYLTNNFVPNVKIWTFGGAESAMKAWGGWRSAIALCIDKLISIKSRVLQKWR